MPSFLTGVSVAPLTGERTPAVQTGSCSGGTAYSWSFAGSSTLQLNERVTTTISAVLDPALTTSTTGTVEASMPYDDGGELETLQTSVNVIIDVDIPTVQFVAPTPDLLIGGGVTDVVVGGNAFDDTTWIERVELTLPAGGGNVTAVGTETWAYTWNLPADGTYTLQAQSFDYVGRASTSASVQVQVDNTAPVINFPLANDTVLSGQGSGVITVPLNGTVSDNLSGVERLQISINGKPWQEIPFTGGNWVFDWRLPNEESAQGRHEVKLRAYDVAGNLSGETVRTLIVDVLPPTARLTNNAFLTDNPAVQPGQTFTLNGVANDAGNAPQPSNPAVLNGNLNTLDDATIWLEPNTVFDNNSGVHVAWLGDINGDRLADLAVGLPAAENGAGRVAIIFGRAGGWPAPPNEKLLNEARTSYIGRSGSTGLGTTIAPAGDVDGNGFDDFLIGDAAHNQVHLLLGRPDATGPAQILSQPISAQSVRLSAPSGTAIGNRVAAAGDVNGDGFDDLLISSDGASYLILGQGVLLPEIDVTTQAAVVITHPQATAFAAGVGDMDGDELDEFALANPATGQTYLFVGQTGLTAAGQTALDTSDAVTSYAASSTAVVPLGDVSGDSLADFMIANGGSPRLVLGSAGGSGSCCIDFGGLSPAADGFIAGVGNVSDTANEGLNDIVIGNANGDAYLFLGSSGLNTVPPVAATLTGAAAGASVPYGGGGDLNADGSDDLLLVPSTALAGLNGLADVPLAVAQTALLPQGVPSISADRPEAAFDTNAVNAPQAVQAILTVDDDGCPGCYTTIQAAVDAAAAGDTINIQPGVYGSFAVSGTNNLIINGVHADAVFVDGGGAADSHAVRITNATGVSLSNVTLRNADRLLWLEDAGVAGYDTPANRTTISNLLFLDFKHAFYLNRRSTLVASRSTLVGQGADPYIEVYGPADPDLDGDWSSLANTLATVADGGHLLLNNSSELLLLRGQNTTDLNRYNIGTNDYTARAASPGPFGANSGAAMLNGILYGITDPVWGNTNFTFGSIKDVAVAGNEIFVVAGSTGYRWNGVSWSALVENISENSGYNCGVSLNTVAVYNNLVVFGGCFTNFDSGATTGINTSSNFIAYNLTTESWENGGDGMGSNVVQQEIVDIAVEPTLNRMVAVSGLSDDGTVYEWSGTVWNSIDGGNANAYFCDALTCNSDSFERVFILSNGHIYVTGQFNAVGDGSNNIYGNRLAYFDGTSWHGVGSPDLILDGTNSAPSPPTNGFNTAPNAVALINGQVVFGGNLTTAYSSTDNVTSTPTPVSNLATWNGSVWSTFFGGTNGEVVALHVADNQLYVGGSFDAAGGLAATNGVASWSPAASWQQLGQGILNGSSGGNVRAIAAGPGQVVFGGLFDTVNGQAIDNITTLSRVRASYNPGGNTWSTLTENNSVPLGPYQEVVLAGAGTTELYALLVGSSAHELWRYTVSTGLWDQRATLNSSAASDTPHLETVGSDIYAVRGGGSSELWRYSSTGNSWTQLADAPFAFGAGGSLASDGQGGLLAIAGGNGRQFMRYNIAGNSWTTLGDGSAITTSDDDLPASVNAGGDSVIVNDVLYATRGGNSVSFYQFTPVNPAADKLTYDSLLFVAPASATSATWSAYGPGSAPADFGFVDAGGNRWVGGNGSLTWTPSVTNQTFAAAAFLKPAANVYRLTSSSVVTAGYQSFVADATVSSSGCPGCFSSIQAAINSGANLVTIEPGQYLEAFYLLNGVPVRGSRADLTVIEAPGGAAQVVQAEGLSDANVGYLTIDGQSTANGLLIEDGTTAALTRLVVRDAQTAVAIDSSATRLTLVNGNLINNTSGVVSTNQAGFNLRNSIVAYNSGSGLSHAANAAQQAHSYNLFWQNGSDFGGAASAGAGELFLDPLFNDWPNGDYRTSDLSPVIDAGDPSDPAPPSDERVDIGVLEQGSAAFYVDDDYCPICPNDGLSWGIDAFATIQEALDAAASRLAAVGTALSTPAQSVFVAPGTYDEQLDVPSHVRLIGSGPDQTILQPSSGSAAATLDGVTNIVISGLRIDGGSGVTNGIVTQNAANSFVIERNLLVGFSGTAVSLTADSTGEVRFNTVLNSGSGVSASGGSSWVIVENNVLNGMTGSGLVTASGGRIFNDFNLFFNNAQDLNDGAGTGLSIGTSAVTGQDPQLNGPHSQLVEASPAVDAADPTAAVPAGGGLRADIGYHELTAAPVAVFLGDIDNSLALANSGVSQVEAALVLTADVSQPVTATLPSTWISATLEGSSGDTVRFWSADFVPATPGLYRVYSRATDDQSNGEEATAWYDGLMVVDGSAPVITNFTASSTTTAPVELRADVSDFVSGKFNIDSVYFDVNGTRVPGEWVPESWDGGQPRTFRAWVSLSNGSYTATAGAVDKAGNATSSTPIALNITAQNPDASPPTVTISSPDLPADLAGGAATAAQVTLTGTAADGESGLLGVEASLDGGLTWTAGTITGSSWSITLEQPEDQEFVTYTVIVRVRDRAGNVTTATTTLTFDDDAPRGIASVTFNPPVGSHLDFAQDLVVSWDAPIDGSGVANALVAIDQAASTVPSAITAGTAYTTSLNANGEWYAHIALQDGVNNQVVRHYGPWYVGDISSPICSARRQSIQPDGELTFGLEEWLTDDELLDDDERPVGRDAQLLYTAWDAQHFYVAWEGARWNTDGTLWVYLDVTGGGSSQAIDGRILPLSADFAVEIMTETAGTLHQWNGSGWQSQGAVEFTQGEAGATEIRLPFGTNSYSGPVSMIAYAVDETNDVWSVFPTTNPLGGSWNTAYSWADLCALVAPNAGQPQAKNIELVVGSPQSTNTPAEPATDLSYDIRVTSQEPTLLSNVTLDVATTTGLTYQSASGGACSSCPVGGSSWQIDLPPLTPGQTVTVSITGTLESAVALSALEAVTTTVDAVRNSVVLDSGALSHPVDGRPPEVSFAQADGSGILPGVQAVSGVASDGSGIGLDEVRVRIAGDGWTVANGTTNWTADLTIPVVQTVNLELQAVDLYGNASAIRTIDLVVDQVAPSVSFSLPAYVNQLITPLSGTSRDILPEGGEIARVEVQFDSDTSPYQPAALNAPAADGTTSWLYTWNAPQVDGETRQLRLRSTDAAGNQSVTGWFTTTVDTVAPVITVTNVISSVEFESYYQTPTGPAVISGTVSDNLLTEVVARVHSPRSNVFTATLPINSGLWEYDFALPLAEGGTFLIWIEAFDAAGNRTIEGSYEVDVTGVQFDLYLPVVYRDYRPPAPDLVVREIAATTTGVEVTIENVGLVPVSDSFWVEVYINPSPPPTAVNQIWNDLANRGLVWGVTEALPAGGTLTLTIGDQYFAPELSAWSGVLAEGTPVYAQVDSAAEGSDFGAVLEGHEIDGTAYNNILGPVVVTP